MNHQKKLVYWLAFVQLVVASSLLGAADAVHTNMVEQAKSVVPRPVWGKDLIPLRVGCMWIYGNPFHFDSELKSRTQAYFLIEKDDLEFLARTMLDHRIRKLTELSEYLFRHSYGGKMRCPVLAFVGGPLIHESFSKRKVADIDELILGSSQHSPIIGALLVEEDDAHSRIRLSPLKDKELPQIIVEGKIAVDWIRMPNGFMGLPTNSVEFAAMGERQSVTIDGSCFDSIRVADCKTRRFVSSVGIGFVAQYISESYRPEPTHGFINGEPDQLFKNPDFPKLACISRIIYYYFPGPDSVEWVNSQWLKKNGEGHIMLNFHAK